MSANDELQAHTCEKILQECGDVANNVVQPKVQDLTEQWKKGELEIGRYYIKYRGNYMSDNWHGDCWEDSWSEYVEEVLAPVPSYEELEELKIDNHSLNAWIKNFQPKYKEMEKENAQLRKFLEEFNALEVAKENQQLKELLKEVRDAWVIYKPYDRNQLCKRIDNAIGEKK